MISAPQVIEGGDDEKDENQQQETEEKNDGTANEEEKDDEQNEQNGEKVEEKPTEHKIINRNDALYNSVQAECILAIRTLMNSKVRYYKIVVTHQK